MIAKELLNPKSIAVIGASGDTQKPGGSILRNLLNSNFKGEVYTVNPKETEVQGVKCYQKVERANIRCLECELSTQRIALLKRGERNKRRGRSQSTRILVKDAILLIDKRTIRRIELVAEHQA